MELRTVVLTLGSFVLTSLVVSNAFYQKKQFYPSVVHLTKSNPSMAVIYIQALVFVVLMGKIVRKIFFGQLRAAELEHLIERSWYAVTETCLAFTVFRDDFSPKFVALFTLLLFVKCFHWLAEDRVDYMERSPVITLLFHVRMMGIVGLLSAVDSYFVSHAYFTTLLRGASVQLVFGFEYAILLTAVFMISTKYILHTMDLRNIHPWENKAVYLLYSELVLDFIRVVLYTVFMVVMMKLHTFPLFSVRPMYLTIRSFKKALHDVIMSRRAINYMNNVYPDATAEELHSGDNVCIICREEMVTAAKKLPCNHIFHTACLRSWFQRQQTCPTCRLDILQIPVRPQTQQQPQQPAAPPLPPPPHAHPHQFMAGVQAAPQPAIGGIPPPNAGFPPQFNMPPGMMPPFMPQMPFMLPFPTAPNFAGLTDDEVRRMEGNERQAIEQRVQCLRNIQTLLDAATVQLHQYLSIMTAITAAPQFAATIVPPTVPPPATTNNTTATPADTTSDEAANSSSVVFTAGESAFAATNGTEEEPNATEESQPSSSGGSAESSDIRQRRLEHFQTKLKTNSIPPPT